MVAAESTYLVARPCNVYLLDDISLDRACQLASAAPYATGPTLCNVDCTETCVCVGRRQVVEGSLERRIGDGAVDAMAPERNALSRACAVCAVSFHVRCEAGVSQSRSPARAVRGSRPMAKDSRAVSNCLVRAAAYSDRPSCLPFISTLINSLLQVLLGGCRGGMPSACPSLRR